MKYDGHARIVGRNEEEDVMRLCRQLHQENGMFSMDDTKVREMLARAFDRKGGILAGVGAPGKLEGLLYIFLTSFWYSEEPYWEELFLYVSPEHRKSKNAVDLINFGKWCVEETGFPLFIGILSNHSTERKEVFYKRQLHTEGAGHFFVYQKKKDEAA